MVQCYSLLVVFFIGGYAFPASKDAPGYDGKDVWKDIFFDHKVMNIDSRILGGSEAGEGTYPWMAAITTGFMTTMFLCGGALITNRHILTAAHCNHAITSSGQVLNARVLVGTNKWNDGGTSYSPRILATNPDYNPFTRKNDIGIIGTASDIALNDRVFPIPISYDFVPGGVLVRVSGWGWLQSGGTLSNTLQELRLLTLDGEGCVAEVMRVAQSLGMNVPRVDPNFEICTFLTGNEGICIGDSGSPLVRNSNNQLIGIASWGVLCARGAPDMFTRVSMYQSWIQVVLNMPI